MISCFLTLPDLIYSLQTSFYQWLTLWHWRRRRKRTYEEDNFESRINEVPRHFLFRPQVWKFLGGFNLTLFGSHLTKFGRLLMKVSASPFLTFQKQNVWHGKKFWVPMRNWTADLRIPRSEPQRLHGERGLLRSSYDTRPAYCYKLYSSIFSELCVHHLTRLESFYTKSHHRVICIKSLVH